MPAGHLAAVPAIALQLALQVEQYRHAARAMAGMPRDQAARQEAAACIRAAGVLAFGVPAIWPSWGDMIVRHMAFVGDWPGDRPSDELMRAWRRLEDRAEIVIERCIDWALRQQSVHPLAPEVSEVFLAWDEARREAFGIARQIDALDEMSPRTGSIKLPAPLRERYETAAETSTRLSVQAAAALRVPAPVPAEGSPDPLKRFEMLHGDWRSADEAAAAAELAIFEMLSRGLPVEDRQREQAAQLRAEARMHRQAIFEAARL